MEKKKLTSSEKQNTANAQSGSSSESERITLPGRGSGRSIRGEKSVRGTRSEDLHGSRIERELRTIQNGQTGTGAGGTQTGSGTQTGNGTDRGGDENESVRVTREEKTFRNIRSDANYGTRIEREIRSIRGEKDKNGIRGKKDPDEIKGSTLKVIRDRKKIDPDAEDSFEEQVVEKIFDVAGLAGLESRQGIRDRKKQGLVKSFLTGRRKIAVLCAVLIAAMIPAFFGVFNYVTTNNVTYDANGGKGEMADQVVEKNTETELAVNDFKRTGYDYEGWSTSPDGEVEYADADEVSNISDDHNVTLYASWSPKEYNVSFDANGGKGKMDDQTLTYDDPEALNSNEFKKKGYKFAGWRIAQVESEQTETEQTDSEKTGSGKADSEKTETGKTDPDKADTQTAGTENTKSADKSDKSAKSAMSAGTESGAESDDQTGSAEKRANASDSAPDQPEASNSTLKSSNTIISNEEEVINLSTGEDITLEAVWAPKKYKVVYDANGGSIKESKKDSGSDSSDKDKSKAEDKDKDTSSDKARDGDNEKDTSGSEDEADGDGKSQNAVYDKKIKLKENSYEREGYVFEGWSTEPITIEAGEAVESLYDGDIDFDEDSSGEFEDVSSSDGKDDSDSDKDSDSGSDSDKDSDSDSDSDDSDSDDLDLDEIDLYAPGEKVKNLTTESEVKLYAVWESKVHIKQEMMIDWCMDLVKDGTYKYGHGYCHICNAKNPKKYDCTGFLRASLAHGVGDKRWINPCAGRGARHGDPPDFCRYLTQTGWECVGLDDENEPKRGDIIAYTRGRIHHVSLYLGEGVIVHCSSMIGGPGTMDYYYGRGETRTLYRMSE